DDDDNKSDIKDDDRISVFSPNVRDEINKYLNKQKSYYTNYFRDKNITYEDLKKEMLMRYFYDNYVEKKTLQDRFEQIGRTIESSKGLIKFIAIASLVSANAIASLKILRMKNH
ncbi:hypothetical protein, partial [Acetobacter tropicalis]